MINHGYVLAQGTAADVLTVTAPNVEQPIAQVALQPTHQTCSQVTFSFATTQAALVILMRKRPLISNFEFRPGRWTIPSCILADIQQDRLLLYTITGMITTREALRNSVHFIEHVGRPDVKALIKKGQNLEEGLLKK